VERKREVATRRHRGSINKGSLAVRSNGDWVRERERISLGLWGESANTIQCILH